MSRMTYPQIIGLSGVARAGKDTVGEILENLYGYTPVSFSAVLNQALINLNPWVLEVSLDGQPGKYVRYAELVDLVGYERAKEYSEVRGLLQRMGTEVGRNLLGENIWVEAMFKNLPPGRVAITNVRFPNEYHAVKDRGGEVWRVDRPGYAAAQGHISDTALDTYQFDWHVLNDGTVRDLAEKVMDRLDDPVLTGLQTAFNR